VNLQIAGAILAGGKSRRYGGRPKGLLQLPTGETIISRLIRLMRETAITELVICGGEGTYQHLGTKVLEDRYPGAGPLAGIERALTEFQQQADAVQFLPCDLPLITANEIRQLQTEFIARRARILFASTCTISCHSLCSIVHTMHRPEIVNAIETDSLSVHQLWSKLEAEAVFFAEERRFANVNQPAELIGILDMTSSGSSRAEKLPLDPDSSSN
jgi:molybdopterin-guanine dinucleotide biosynthesis protein A